MHIVACSSPRGFLKRNWVRSRNENISSLKLTGTIRSLRKVVCFAKEEDEEEVDEKETVNSLADLKEKWDAIDNKPQIAAVTIGSIAGLWLTLAVVGTIDKVPLIPKILELVGLGYIALFTYRYLLFESSRNDLIRDFEDLKAKVIGSE